MPATYQQLFDAISALAKKYNLQSYLEGYDAELVNILLQRPGNWEQFMAADTFQKTMDMANTALSNYATGGWLSVTVQSYVTDEKDLVQLYELGKEWRRMRMAELAQLQMVQQQQALRYA